MDIIPVLDLLDGKVVHGIGGKRKNYQPIVNSVITSSFDPIIVASDFRDKLNLAFFYIADLDLIQRTGKKNIQLVEKLSNQGYSIMFDGGFRNFEDINKIDHKKIDFLVLGTETIQSLTALESIIQLIGSEKIIISIDLKGGEILANSPEISTLSALEIAKTVEKLGVFAVIVLDLQKVGSEAGPLNKTLLNIRKALQNTKVFAGGGVKNFADLKTLAEHRIDGVLIATALHKGTISNKEIKTIQTNALD